MPHSTATRAGTLSGSAINPLISTATVMTTTGRELPHLETGTARWPKAKKSLGQHFLVDRRVLARILRAADPQPDETIVEVGPGHGTLTAELAQRGARVIAVELDQALAARLEGRFADTPAVRVEAGDARNTDPSALVDGEPYKFVANLPYYAALPILRRFLESDHPPTRIVVMVQREVAETMTAKPGGMTLLSVGVQLYGRPAIVCRAGPRSFRPPPKVASAVVRIDVYTEPALALESIEGFFRVVRAGFSAPRKMIRNSLRHGLGAEQGEVLRVLEDARVEPTLRPGALSLEDWGRVHRALEGQGAAAAC